MELKISVQHWRFMDGVPEVIERDHYLRHIYPTGFRDTPPKGWYGWCYPNNDGAFLKWIKVNCPTASTTHRYNSGDPMWQIYIKSEKEAMVFQLRWL